MKPTEKDIALLERYFDAELNEEEQKNFASRVEQDKDFNALVQREKVIIGAIRNQGLLDNLAYLKSIEEKIEGNHSIPLSSNFKTWHYYSAAAVIVLLIAVKFLLPSSQQTSQELFTSYFKAYPNMFEPTVRGANEVTKRTEAFQAYEQGNYKKASLLFTELLKENQEPGVLLLLGNANLMLGQVAEAQKNLVTLIEESDDLDIQAKWYLSLAYLKSGDKEKARKILRELGGTEISYASKAKELLEKVD
jgi:tetratricopeptide (TPR) repeat protein